MLTRRMQCLELARIFRRYAAEERQEKLKAARYWDLALQYEVEAAHEETTR